MISSLYNSYANNLIEIKPKTFLLLYKLVHSQKLTTEKGRQSKVKLPIQRRRLNSLREILCVFSLSIPSTIYSFMNHFPSTYLSLGPGTHRWGAHSPEALDPLGERQAPSIAIIEEVEVAMWVSRVGAQSMWKEVCWVSAGGGMPEEKQVGIWPESPCGPGSYGIWNVRQGGLDWWVLGREVWWRQNLSAGWFPHWGWMMPGSYWNIQANDSESMVSPWTSSIIITGSLSEMHILGSTSDLWTQDLWASGQSVLGSPDLMLMAAEV